MKKLHDGLKSPTLADSEVITVRECHKFTL